MRRFGLHSDGGLLMTSHAERMQLGMALRRHFLPWLVSAHERLSESVSRLAFPGCAEAAKKHRAGVEPLLAAWIESLGSPSAVELSRAKARLLGFDVDTAGGCLALKQLCQDLLAAQNSELRTRELVPVEVLLEGGRLGVQNYVLALALERHGELSRGGRELSERLIEDVMRAARRT